jgi:hypothetical protein
MDGWMDGEREIYIYIQIIYRWIYIYTNNVK